MSFTGADENSAGLSLAEAFRKRQQHHRQQSVDQNNSEIVAKQKTSSAKQNGLKSPEELIQIRKDMRKSKNISSFKHTNEASLNLSQNEANKIDHGFVPAKETTGKKIISVPPSKTNNLDTSSVLEFKSHGNK